MGMHSEENPFFIVFDGELLPGRSKDEAVNNLAKIFKTDTSRIAQRMFSGKRLVICNNLPKEEAIRRKKILNRAGLECRILRPKTSQENAVSRKKQKTSQRRLIAVAALSVILLTIAILGGLQYFGLSNLPFIAENSPAQAIAGPDKSSGVDYSTSTSLSVKLNKILIGLSISEKSKPSPPKVHVYVHDKLFSKDGEAIHVGNGKFHIRLKGTFDFWEVDTRSQKMFFVPGSEFGSKNTKGQPYSNINLFVNRDKAYEGGVKDFTIELSEGTLSVDKMGRAVSIIINPIFVRDDSNWEIAVSTDGKYMLRNKNWHDDNSYFEITHGQEYLVTVNKRFGKADKLEPRIAVLEARPTRSEGRLNDISEIDRKVRPDKGKMDSFGFREPNASQWVISQKALYANLLKGQAYDVMVVPFQVHYNAFDRAGRSLMTRYLANAIEKKSGLKVANPTLVARALDVRGRRFNLNEVYALAAKLKVKYLVMGYVGHNMDERLLLQVLVQERQGQAQVTKHEPLNSFSWLGLEFSDENLPSEVFKGIIDEVLSKMPFEGKRKIKKKKFRKVKVLNVPESPADLFRSSDGSPVKQAYYLQLAGMLYPIKGIAMEGLFERSLVALEGVDPASPDYRLLKSRALFYLHRRPAAIKALGKPETPEEKAFQALLNGNLPDLDKWQGQIKSPLLSLMTTLELSDLKTTYTKKPAEESFTEGLSKDYPKWEPYIIQRIYRDNPWYVQSNAIVKAILDKEFPVDGDTVQDVVSKNQFRGKYQDIDHGIDFSVYEHIVKLIKKDGTKHFLKSNGPELSSADYIDMLDQSGEANIIASVRRIITGKSLYKQGIEELDKYEVIYKEHPMLTTYRYLAVRELANEASGPMRSKLFQEKRRLLDNIIGWFQGQEDTPVQVNTDYFRFDFPMNADWTAFHMYYVKYRSGPFSGFEDRDIQLKKKLKVTYYLNLLKYSNVNFEAITEATEILRSESLTAEADALIKANEHRFNGHPDKITVFAQQMSKDGDLEGVKKAYEQAMKANPEAWKPYEELGELLVREGDFKRALSAYLKYPLFNEAEKRDIVTLSNNASYAGRLLAWAGSIEESKELLKLSVSMQSGSHSNMMAGAWLATMEEDYPTAASYYYYLIQRYNSGMGFSRLASLLFISGQNDDGWKVINSIGENTNTKKVYRALMVGFRQEGKKDKEVLEWVKKSRKFESSGLNPFFVITNNCWDRKPDKSLPKLIEDYAPFDVNNPSSRTEKQLAYVYRKLAKFAEGYVYMRNADNKKSLKLLVPLVVKYKTSSSFLASVREHAYLYASISAARTGDYTTLSSLHDKFMSAKDKYQSDYFMLLAKAYAKGKKGNHDKAVEDLRKASYQIPWSSDRMLSPWYQMVEVTEMLFDETGHEGYRNLAIELARHHQRIMPMFAWAYAVEAKLSKSGPKRERALGAAMYLDRNSERISKISKKEKEKALERFKATNPFAKEPANNTKT